MITRQQQTDLSSQVTHSKLVARRHLDVTTGHRPHLLTLMAKCGVRRSVENRRPCMVAKRHQYSGIGISQRSEVLPNLTQVTVIGYVRRDDHIVGVSQLGLVRHLS
jgi:hypothetical protein